MVSRQRIARNVRMAVENRLALAWEDRAARRGAVAASEVAEPGHILLAPPGAGNIGDRAMTEAFLASVNGPVTLIVRRASDLPDLPSRDSGPVNVMVAPGLLYGLPWQHVRDARRFRALLPRARSVSVIGADIMDGAYWESPSVRRFRLALIAAEAGVDARVLGFSWNARPTAAARRAMVRASAAVRLLPRDPASAERLERDGAVNVVPTADIAFLTPRRPIEDLELDAWVTARVREGRRLVLLNSNGLIESDADTVRIYREFIREAPADVVFVAVAHVSRGTPSDIELAETLGRDVDDGDRLYVQRSLLRPGEVAELAAQAHLVVTGRMHLTILSTTVGTPVITVAYQGKVAGLYRELGTDTWLEAEDARDRLAGLIRATLPDAERLREALAAVVPRLVRRAALNVEGLTTGGRDADHR